MQIDLSTNVLQTLILIMAEGDDNSLGIAAVDASDVFNPTTRCVHCDAQNDISETRCIQCGRDIYDNRKWSIEEEQADMLNAQMPKSSSSNFNLPFGTKVCSSTVPVPSALSLILPQSVPVYHSKNSFLVALSTKTDCCSGSEFHGTHSAK